MSNTKEGYLMSRHLHPIKYTNHGMLQGLDNNGIHITGSEVKIDGHFDAKTLIQVVKVIAPEKIEDLTKLMNWQLTKELIKEVEYRPDYLSEIWRDYCQYQHDSHLEDVESELDPSLFEEILKKTQKRIYLHQYEEHSEILKTHYENGLYRVVMELIEERRQELPASVDFIKGE